MEALRKYLIKFEEHLLFLLMGVMTVVTFAQVFFRFVLNSPLAWSEELARYLFVWITFIGASVALHRWGHFQVDIVVNLFPDKVKRITEIVVYLLIMIFAFIMVYYGFILVQYTSTQLSPALQLNMAIPYFALPLSGILIFFHTLERLLFKDNGGKGEEK
ncbi:MAG: TRAP-type transport system small permease protein [Thermoanaerobacteraceae bacterium]|jgi:TRAP-type C4-dicarboxylate transport system permease small subunit|uniref:TRAP transporter small permease n=1 Tax=Biomaibacter acetigenes TaxID=2316383 RepID=A0A3G2R3M8_9FIRM|nr:TRAP transporter small permease [Biomaibacter acetigenes]AYO29547.1 TRAP transporter small permease [Biomaibacter acetigenes]MDK2878236.1 TRAP-type transport system small permease protein [Thermoanaerobacteraceae bacterium]